MEIESVSSNKFTLSRTILYLKIDLSRKLLNLGSNFRSETNSLTEKQLYILKSVSKSCVIFSRKLRTKNFLDQTFVEKWNDYILTLKLMETGSVSSLY